MPRQGILVHEHQVRPRRGIAYHVVQQLIVTTHPPVGLHRVQRSPRLLAAAEFLDHIKCGIVKELTMAAGGWSSH